MKKKGLFLVCTTRTNGSPSFLIEILGRICKVNFIKDIESSYKTQVIKDFCGVLTEDAIRKNFILIYEILDEIIVTFPHFSSSNILPKDYGHPQITTTEKIKPFIVSEPIAAKKKRMPIKLNFFNKNTKSSKAIEKSVVARDYSKKKKNEIFVDVYEKISILFNSSGYTINSAIDGCIQMKSYLQGSPILKLSLPEDLAIG